MNQNSNLSSDFNNEWIDIDNGVLVDFETNDSGTTPIDIGFDFPFYGEIYSEFIINANGWIGFEDDSGAWYNGNIPSEDAPKSAIFGFWDDLNPINQNCNEFCSGNVYYDSNSERLVVWFDNVSHWVSEGFENTSYDFQVVIYPDGEVDINLRTIEGNYSATVGMQNSSGTIAIQVDEYNGDYFSDNMSFRFVRPFIPSEWLSVNSDSGLSGDLNYGESQDFDVLIDSAELIEGEYNADLIITTNYSNTISIPIALSVLEELGLLGDLNGDLDVNVSDIVILVNLILQSDYAYNGDMNQDAILDVIDIVQLVNLILN